jgi:hypothetical protein
MKKNQVVLVKEDCAFNGIDAGQLGVISDDFGGSFIMVDFAEDEYAVFPMPKRYLEIL